MPPPKKLRAFRVVQGTESHDSSSEPINLPLADGVPPPPPWLPNQHAIDEWNRIVPILHGVGILTNAGLSTLGMLCSVHGEIVALMSAGGHPPAHMFSQYRGFASEFGLTPVAQTKVKAGDITKKPGNRFEGRKRPA